MFKDLHKVLGGGLHKVVNSCLVTRCNVDDLWERLKYSPEKLFPELIKLRTFMEKGSADKVNSTFTEMYSNGSKWTFRITDVSDIHRTIVCELIETDKDVEKPKFTSMTSRWTLRPITMTPDTCMFEWELNYSSDVTPTEVECARKHVNSYMHVLKNLETTTK